MVTKELLIITFVILFVMFGIFITIVHFYRRSKMPDKFIWQMDSGINVIDTLIYFFKEMKARKERKRKKNGNQ